LVFILEERTLTHPHPPPINSHSPTHTHTPTPTRRHNLAIPFNDSTAYTRSPKGRVLVLKLTRSKWTGLAVRKYVRKVRTIPGKWVRKHSHVATLVQRPSAVDGGAAVRRLAGPLSGISAAMSRRDNYYVLMETGNVTTCSPAARASVASTATIYGTSLLQGHSCPRHASASPAKKSTTTCGCIDDG